MGRRGLRLRSAWLWTGLAALTVSTSSCDFWYNRVPSPDDLWHVIPWFDHMIHSKYVRPYETDSVPRYTPLGTVPISGGEADWSAEWSTGKTAASDALRNPYAAGRAADQRTAPPGPEVAIIPQDVAAAGDTLYQTFCAVCHGSAGDAKGPMSAQMGAPSLLTGRSRGYSDGYLYSIVRYGRGVMPRYGDKVYRAADRWAIVNHIRKLQSQTPAAAEPPGAGAGIPPGASATGSTGERPR